MHRCSNQFAETHASAGARYEIFFVAIAKTNSIQNMEMPADDPDQVCQEPLPKSYQQLCCMSVRGFSQRCAIIVPNKNGFHGSTVQRYGHYVRTVSGRFVVAA